MAKKTTTIRFRLDDHFVVEIKARRDWEDSYNAGASEAALSFLVNALFEASHNSEREGFQNTAASLNKDACDLYDVLDSRGYYKGQY